MTVKLLVEQHLEFLGLNVSCAGSSESTLVKIPHCWKSGVTAQLFSIITGFLPNIFQGINFDRVSTIQLMLSTLLEKV